MYECVSWTIKKAEHQRTDALEMWCWRRLLRVPWTAKRSVHTFHPAIPNGSVQLLSRVQLFATPWTAARQASLSITNSQSLPKHLSIESVMLSNHLILCCPLLLLPSIFPTIRVFPNELALCIRWPKY